MIDADDAPAGHTGAENRAGDFRDASEAVSAGRFEQAIPALRHILAATPDHLPARILLGVSLAGTGQAGAAEGMLRSAAALDPVNIDARLRLGQLLVDLGRRAEALMEYRAVLTVDPDHPTARGQVIALSDPLPPA